MPAPTTCCGGGNKKSRPEGGNSGRRVSFRWAAGTPPSVAHFPSGRLKGRTRVVFGSEQWRKLMAESRWQWRERIVACGCCGLVRRERWLGPPLDRWPDLCMDCDAAGCELDAGAGLLWRRCA